MRGPTCPKCGTVNATGRFSCIKCYAPLDTPTDQAKAAGAARARKPSPPKVSLWPNAEALKSVTPYEIVLVLVALGALAGGLAQVGGSRLWVYFAAAALTAAGLSVVVRFGSLDLSLGSVIALGALVGICAGDYGAGATLAAAAAVGALVGGLNASIVRLRGLPPALGTLGTGAVIAGLILAYVPDAAVVEDLGGYAALAGARVLGLPVPLLVLIVALLFGQYVARLLAAKRREGDPSPADPEAGWAHVLAGAYAALAGVLLGAASARPGDLLHSAWLLLPFAALTLGGGVLLSRRASLLAAVSGGALVAVPLCHVEQSGMPVLGFLVAGVILLVGSVLDFWKAESWRALLNEVRSQTRPALGSLCCAVLVGSTGWFVLGDALHRVPPQSAMILKAVGEVAVLPQGATTWREGGPRTLLTPGAALRTGPEAAALVITARGSAVKIDPGSEVAFERIEQLGEEGRDTKLRVSSGRLWSLVKHAANEKTKFTVETPTVTAAVRGTRFSMLAARRRNYVSCDDGNVEVNAHGKTVFLKPGTETEVRGDGPPAPPRAMSPSERQGWARERELLKQPLRRQLWQQSRDQSGFLADSFNADALDPVTWRMRAPESGLQATQRNGRLEVLGDPSLGTTVTYSHGLVSQSFASQACEAAVKVQVREGSTAAVLRLADERGSRAGAALVFHPTAGVWLEGPDGSRGGTPEAARGFQMAYANLVLRYEPAVGLVTGYCDGARLGAVDCELGESLHWEVVGEGRRPGQSDKTVLWFDDFSTDIKLEPEKAVRLMVAALGDDRQPEQQGALLVVQPLRALENLRQVTVSYPFKLLNMKTRLYAQGSRQGKLRFDRKAGAWFLRDGDGHPSGGDYLFELHLRGKDETLPKYLRLSDPSRRPSLEPLTEKLTSDSLQLRWTLPQGVAGEWVELVEVRGEGSKRYRPSEVGGVSLSRDELDGWRQVMAVLIARVGREPTDAQVEEWGDMLSVLRSQLKPGMAAWVKTSSPDSAEEFLLRCGKAWDL